MAINGNANGHNGNDKCPYMALRMAIMAITMAMHGNHKGIIMAILAMVIAILAMINGHTWQ